MSFSGGGVRSTVCWVGNKVYLNSNMRDEQKALETSSWVVVSTLFIKRTGDGN